MSDADDDLRRLRGQRYAEGTLTLSENALIPGAEGLFNQALTNGVLAIAVTEGLDVTEKKGDRLRPATAVLRLLIEQWPDDHDELQRLLETVGKTDHARHGRPAVSRLTEQDIEDLAALDRRPGLGLLSGTTYDRDWVRDRAADSAEHDRATDYLELLRAELGEDELERRAEASDGVGTGAPGDVWEEAQECPVCGYEAMAVIGTDDQGYNIGYGTCAVCSYQRSRQTADWMGHDQEIQRLIDKDD